MSELATVEQSFAPVDVNYWTEWLVFAARVAEKVSDTEFVAAPLRGRPEAVAAVILYGAEVGITPMQALQGIHIVEGRPAPSAELMRALILRAGHSLAIHESTGTRCRVSGLRRGRPETERVVVEWTLDMARAAGLLGRRNWQSYPRAMLTARASGDLARILFPDVIKGLGYVAEDASADFAPEPVPERTATGSRRPLQRRTRTIEPPAVQDVPVPVPDVPDPVPVAPELSSAVPPRDDTPPAEDRDTRVREAMGERPSGPAPTDVPVLPDELEPEPSAPEPADHPPAMIGPGLLKALHAGLTSQLGTVATREEKHALVSAIVQRDIETTKNLSRAEAYRVLEYLDRFQSGTAMFSMDPDTGGITVTVPDPAPDGTIDVPLPYSDA